MILDIPLDEPSPKPNLPRRKLLTRKGNSDDFFLHLDNTSLESFSSCDRAAELRLIHGRVPHAGAPLIYGQAIHAALELHYKTQADYESLCQAGYDVLSRVSEAQLGWRNFDMLCTTLAGYLKTYKSSDFSVFQLTPETPAVELPFEHHLGTLSLEKTLPYSVSQLVNHEDSEEPVHIKTLYLIWTGVIDLITQDKSSGNLFVVDHKTTSVLGPAYYEQFTLSQQFIGYATVASEILSQSSEHKIAGAIVNVLASRQPSKTGKSIEYARRHYLYSSEKREDWKNDVLALAGSFVQRLTDGFFPKRSLWCVGKFGTCPYLSICQLPNTSKPYALMSDDFTDNVWNPLNKP